MCTVTFMPRSTTDFVLTSNRDESPSRETVPPKIYDHDGIRLLYPKDALAGGTWIGLSEHNRLICLLNGGFEPHEREEQYRMSRGVIVTDLLVSDHAHSAIASYDFAGIEPFTIILVDWNKQLNIYELVWDGTEKHFHEKPLAPQIWSSSLLYTTEAKRKREHWFSNFLFESMSPSEENILHFHRTAGEGNREIDLIMDRGFVRTKSISQITKNETHTTLRYEDLQIDGVAIETI